MLLVLPSTGYTGKGRVVYKSDLTKTECVVDAQPIKPGEQKILDIRARYNIGADVDDLTLFRRAYWSRRGYSGLHYVDGDYRYYEKTKIVPYLVHGFSYRWDPSKPGYLELRELPEGA